MKTLQEQYNLIKEGKGNKAYFLKTALRQFPNMLSPVNTFEDTVTILKNRSIISENTWGITTTGKKQDWHSIFNENMTTLKEEKEAKAEEKETTKEVTDMATRGYDYKDEKNYDNVFGQEFLQGYYTEMKDPKNADKHVEELRAIVAKNLAKDINYYVKDGQFGIKGVGYQTEAPGLGEPKEPKGKFKSSGYGDLKESVLRSQIHILIKEVMNELPPLKAGDAGIYDGEKVDIIAVSMHAKTNKDESQPFSYTIKKGETIYKEVPISAVKPSLAEAEDKKEDKEEAKKKKEELKKLDKEWKKKLKTGDID